MYAAIGTSAHRQIGKLTMASDSNRNRPFTIQLVFVLAALLLILKALQLQVLDPTYRDNGDAAAIQNQTIYPARGLMYDRNRKLLIYNTPAYDIMLTYNQVDWTKFDTTKFCNLLGITRNYFIQNAAKDWTDQRYSKNVPFAFMSKVSPDVCVRFQESAYAFPGFTIQLRHARGYPHRNAAHLLGYIREVNPGEITKNKAEGGYKPGDYIGASGLEKQYEKELSGEKGLRRVLKDNLGRDMGSYEAGAFDTKPKSGANLITTIDLDLQAYGEYLMQNKIGGIVAIEPKTGEVLAMISAPTYDPNLLTLNQNRSKEFAKLLSDSNKVFLDRSVQAMYPPGSLFKPAVALVALKEGVLHENRTIGCRMGYYGGGFRTACHRHVTCTNVALGIQHSCNAYFVTVFRDMVDRYGAGQPKKGLNSFTQYLERFGLGEKLGIDFPNEKGGFYPDSDYYTRVYERQQKGQGNLWNSNWIRSVGIGQGELLMTTLQMANLGAMIGNRGFFVKPHLIKQFEKDNTLLDIDGQYTKRNHVGIEWKYFVPVIDGMRGAVTGGTARVANIPDIEVCGKTGTAENPHGKDHSIFYGFAPKDNPKIAIAVYVENAGFGATYAAPIASLMIEKYMNDTIRHERKFLEQRIVNANLLSGKEPVKKRLRD
jgi:penicillin-binding protein 2